MTQRKKQIFFRSSLLIFVNEAGITIFERLNAIKQEVGLIEPLQQCIGLIFYRSEGAYATFFDKDFPDILIHDTNAYRTRLEDAIIGMLRGLRDNVGKNQQADFSIAWPNPQIYIIADVNEPSSRIAFERVLTTVCKILDEIIFCH